MIKDNDKILEIMDDIANNPVLTAETDFSDLHFINSQGKPVKKIQKQPVNHKIVDIKLSDMLSQSFEGHLLQKNRSRLSKDMFEEFGRLKINMFSLFDKGLKSILSLSILPGEGNSTILYHLAQTLVKTGNEKVLVVDCNFNNPSLHKFFQTEQQNGLTELIFRKTGMERAIKPTAYPNLFLLPTGKTGKITGRIISSPEFIEIKKILELEFDYLLFDCAPLKQKTDGYFLSRQVDGVVLVIQANRTKREVAQDVKKDLLKYDANIIGVILNRRKYPIPNWLYKRI